MDIASTRWSAAEGWSAPLPDWDGPSTLVLAFGTSNLIDRPGALEELCDRYPTSTVTGCSGAGHALGSEITNDGLVVTVVRFRSARVQALSARPADAEGVRATAAELVRRLLGAEPSVSLVLCFADGVGIDGDALAAGLDDAVPDGVVVAGGLAGDDVDFARTWVLDGHAPRTGAIVLVGIAGEGLHTSCSEHGGWDAFGPDRRITGVDGATLHSLDDAPALTLYRNYLGALAVGLPATALLFPLSVRDAADDESDMTVRMVLSTDDAAKSIRFTAGLPGGGWARMMRADFESLIGAAQVAAETAVAVPGEPALALAVSCVGRRVVLGDRTPDELEAALDGLPAGSHLTGVYGYGQLAPRQGRRCRLNNQTIAITTIQETA